MMPRTSVPFVFFICILFQSCLLNTPPGVSKEEALAAAEKLEATVKKGDVEGYLAFYNMPAFFREITTKSSAANKPGVMKGFKSTFTLLPSAQGTINDAKAGSFRLLRSYEKNGRQQLLFRVLSETNINYLDFQLIKVNNTVKAEDVFNYMNGERLSTTLADYMDTMIPGGEEAQKAIKHQTDSVLRMKKLKAAGDYEGVKQVYRRLHPSIQQNKSVLLSFIEVCKITSNEDYKAAVDKFSELFPVSSASYMMLMDVSMLAKDYEKVLFAINKIDEMVGGDPYLDLVRGNVYWLMEKQEESITAFEKVYAYDPDMRRNVEALIVVYMKYNETEKAKKVIAAYKVSKGFDQQVLDLFYQSYPALLK